MMKVSRPCCLAAVLVLMGCGAGSDQAGRGEGVGSAASVSTVDPAQRVWGFPESLTVKGRGACAGASLGGVLDQIRDRFEEVRGIQSFRSAGPRGVAMNAGEPSRAGEAPAPGDGRSAYVVGFMDDQSFGAVFFQGGRCRGQSDVCQDREYWYFDTDEACRPRQVGHHLISERAGGRSGTCFDLVGAPLWNLPSTPDARARCDADWSPQEISGTRRARSIAAGPTCGKAASFLPVEVTITQQADRAKATAVLQGTGLPFLDGRAISGSVERQSFKASLEEISAGDCSVRRKIELNFDFEEPSINAIPGGFGFVDVSESPVAACANGGSGCSASLHLVRGD